MLAITLTSANQQTETIKTVTVVKSQEYTNGPAKYTKVKTLVKENKANKINLSKEDIELIALVTMAEAEGESEKGKRLVIDTILNRMKSEHFPDTAKGVVYQSNQFTSMWNGRVDRCYVRDDICQLVREELDSQMNKEVMFFCAGRYSDYGTPMFSEGDHYFSSYN
jgi:spore germination cell wall hydrolase CwlJ-like protein